MRIFIILFLLGTKVYGQGLTSKEIDKYTKKIDWLMLSTKLTVYSYSEMSKCSGEVNGYYYNKKLVFIDAIHAGEIGFSSQQVYIKNNEIYKITYGEYEAELENYRKENPSDSLQIDYGKITYTNVLYHITLSNPVIFAQESNNEFYIKTASDETIEEFVSCAKIMMAELEKERASR